MKNLKKRALSVLVAAVMCVGMLPATAFAADTNTDPGSNLEVLSLEITPVDLPLDNAGDPTALANNGEDGTDGLNENDVDTPNGDEDDADTPDGTDAGDDANTPDPTPEEPQEPVNPWKGAEFPANGSEADQQAWYDANVERPTQTPGLDTSTGDATDVPATPTEDQNWSVFWNDTTKRYELTYEIDSEAVGDQTIDLTKALELLNQYAQSATAPSKPQEPTATLTPEQEEELRDYEAAKKTFEEEDYPDICRWVEMFNYPGYIKDKGLTVEDVVAEFNSIGIGKAEIPVKPEVPEVDKDSQEYQDYLAALEQYNKDYAAYQQQANANVLQPGDIREFDIYITSKSGHTYKYKDGSFTLSTPKLPESNSGVDGFDGQVLPGGDNGYADRKEYTYNVTAALKPIMDLMKGQTDSEEAKDVIEREIKAGHDGFEDLMNWLANTKLTADVKDENGNVTTPGIKGDGTVQAVLDALGVTYTRTEATSGYSYKFDNLSGAVSDYLVKYYSQKDGKTYANLNDVFAHSSTARADMSSSENTTQSDKGFTFGGETLTTTYGKDFTYNSFYQSLLSFVYGDQTDVDAMLGGITGTQPDSQHPQFANGNWSSGFNGKGLNGVDYNVALEQYMSHQKAWDEANTYFNKLLAEGVSVKSAAAAAFTMAVNIDGELTDNNWQLTKWAWNNSLQLEQMDYDFNLKKPTGTTRPSPATRLASSSGIWRSLWVRMACP